MSKFLKYCKVEPRLEALRQEALEIAQRIGSDIEAARDYWYGDCRTYGLKARMVRLVSGYSETMELSHPLAYNIVYRGLWLCLTGQEL